MTMSMVDVCDELHSPRLSAAYIDPSINPDDKNLLISLSERYTTMLAKYQKKYKKIRIRKIALDMIIFAISSGGIISSIAFSMPIIALVTGGGILGEQTHEAFFTVYGALSKISNRSECVMTLFSVTASYWLNATIFY